MWSLEDQSSSSGLRASDGVQTSVEVTRESDGRLRQLRLGCIIFVNRIEVDKSDLLWLTTSRDRLVGSNRLMEAIAHRLSSEEVNVV